MRLIRRHLQALLEKYDCVLELLLREPHHTQPTGSQRICGRGCNHIAEPSFGDIQLPVLKRDDSKEIQRLGLPRNFLENRFAETRSRLAIALLVCGKGFLDCVTGTERTKPRYINPSFSLSTALPNRH